MAGTVHIVDPTGWSDSHATRLRAEGFVVLRLHDRESAERSAWRRPADLAIVVDTPGRLKTAELLGWLRSSVTTPVAVVASPQDESRFLGWFATGADDVIETDCCPAVFVARVRALLRRSGGLPERAARRISIGDVTVEQEQGSVVVRNHPVHLTPLEFSLLCTLMRDPGVVYSREDLLDSVWGTREGVVERTIDAHIWKLRRKIETGGGRPRYILSVPRLGYRFRRPDQAALAG